MAAKCILLSGSVHVCLALSVLPALSFPHPKFHFPLQEGMEKNTPRKQTWTLTLTTFPSLDIQHAVVYDWVSICTKVIPLAKASLELPSEKSLLCSALPTSLPSKAKTHNVLHKGHTQWLPVAGTACSPWRLSTAISSPPHLTQQHDWHWPLSHLNRHEMTPERCLWTTFPTRHRERMVLFLP